MLAFPEPPAAESGLVYRSLEDRCQSCQVHGEDEAPCVSPERMIAEEEATGFPCPYREPSTPDDSTLLQLITMATNPEVGYLWRACFDVAFETRTPHQRRHRLNMVMRGLTDDRIVKRLKAAHAAAAEEAKKQKAN